jgi:HTH-type transcriptional regulator, sugar sensing transcriptional regulator
VTYEDVIGRLQHLGMSGYEAKTYLALVGAGEPLNGYEVAKRSGVPRSTVYETLAKLVARGAAFEVRGAGDAVDYLPLPVKALLDRLGRDYHESLAALDMMLPAIAAPPTVHLIHNLSGVASLLDRARDVVAGARRELFLSIWPEEMTALRETVVRAEQRGVAVTSIAFGDIGDPVGRTYQHALSTPEVVMENLGCRMLTVVGDRQEAVIGGVTETGAWGVYTDNPAVVLLAVEYIRHDIAIQLMGDHFDADQIRDFWREDPDMNRLRADRGLPAATLQAAEQGGRDRIPARRARRGRSAS